MTEAKREIKVLLDKEHPAVVYDLEHYYGLGGWIDRREMPRRMKVAVDLRDPGERGGMWVYWGSSKTLLKALEGLWKARKELRDMITGEVRVLDSSDFSVILQAPVAQVLRLLHGGAP